MLLFTWASLMGKIQQGCECIFRIMEVPNRNVNIVFIAVGAAGILYWLYRQTQYNAEAERNGTIK
jgi:IS4 transposase